MSVSDLAIGDYDTTLGKRFKVVGINSVNGQRILRETFDQDVLTIEMTTNKNGIFEGRVDVSGNLLPRWYVDGVFQEEVEIFSFSNDGSVKTVKVKAHSDKVDDIRLNSQNLLTISFSGYGDNIRLNRFQLNINSDLVVDTRQLIPLLKDCPLIYLNSLPLLTGEYEDLAEAVTTADVLLIQTSGITGDASYISGFRGSNVWFSESDGNVDLSGMTEIENFRVQGDGESALTINLGTLNSPNLKRLTVQSKGAYGDISHFINSTNIIDINAGSNPTLTGSVTGWNLPDCEEFSVSSTDLSGIFDSSGFPSLENLQISRTNIVPDFTGIPASTVAITAEDMPYSVDVDQWLIDLANSNCSNCSINIEHDNPPRTTASDAPKAILEGRDCTGIS